MKKIVDVMEEKQNVSYLIYYNFIVKEEHILLGFSASYVRITWLPLNN